MILTWSDEFNSGTVPDPSKWSYEVGGGKWGDNQLQCYTSRPENVQVANGNLIITACSEKYVDPATGITWDWTSGRIITLNKFSQLYGRFEARMQLPQGKGTHEAFWMLGTDCPTVGWPACGEIDVGEHVGRLPAMLQGAIHGPGYIGSQIVGATNLPSGQDWGSAFHVYAVDWRVGVVNFYVDGNLFHTMTPKDLPTGGTWEFDKPFYLLLSFAVGGGFAGPPDPSAFPASLLVDYVRVYQ